jgi:hypothetical protein
MERILVAFRPILSARAGSKKGFLISKWNLRRNQALERG